MAETEVIDLPYGAEYAKSARSSCKGCKGKIDKDELRLSTRVQAGNWDGVQDMWHHFDCFWRKPKKNITEASIRGFEGLKWDDQERIRAHLKGNPSKKVAVTVSRVVNPSDLPYGCDYAKSSRAACIVCKGNIMTGELRLSLRVQAKKWDGMQDLWNHFDCFWTEKYDDLTEGAIKGFESLKWDDQERIRSKLVAVLGEGSTGVKDEKEPKVENAEVKAHEITPSSTQTVAPIADYASTGRSKCKGCSLNIAKGEVRLKQKSSFYHPACLQKMNLYDGASVEIKGYSELKEADQVTLKELFVAKLGEQEDGPSAPKKARFFDTPEKLLSLKLQSEKLWEVLNDIRGKLVKDQILSLIKFNRSWGLKKLGPEQNLELLADLIIFGALPDCDSCGKDMLRWNSDEKTYKCCSFISDYTRCPFSNRYPARTEFKVPEEMKNYEFLEKYHDKKILPGGRVYSASVLNNEVTAIKIREQKKRRGEEEENRRCIVKNGCTVDPRCTIAETVHVYIDENKRPWQALLTMSDLASGKNSYYKLQLVEHDRNKLYYVFRSWGRVGTAGGSKTDDFYGNLEEAKDEFQRLFMEKSQNVWGEQFIKVPGGLELIEMEVDDSKVKEAKSLDPVNSNSKLPLPIREIISLFFDVKLMAQQMAEFELDTEKLPLAKLSRNHILRAHSILGELSKILATEEPKSVDILDCCNQFYTLIPHASGLGRLPMINNQELLKKKCDMLDNLLEMEVAYKMIKQEENEESEGNQVDVFDRHYLSLSCGIEILSRESEEFKWIQLYINNGKMKTHHFNVNIKNIFKVERQGESDRYKKTSKKIHNKRMLWHGSRTSNFCGILSRGLCIAPPEAPVNGYMFGKGIYFADCVSKSAQYCSTAGRTDAFLLLAEVALGNMQEECHAINVVKPKKGFHSVKGLGRTEPDEKEAITIDNGIMVPCGKALSKSSDNYLSLLYNEYIIYDEGQAQLKYLIHADIVY